MALYPALAIIMAADAGKDQPPLPLQADQPKTAGEIILTTVSEPILAIVGASAFRFFMQGVSLEGNENPLGSPGNITLILTSLVHGQQLFAKTAGLMDLKAYGCHLYLAWSASMILPAFL